MKFDKINIKRLVIIVGILIIPLMYSYFYLSAFWDPYSKLNDLPVAIVNKDKGSNINEQERNIGNEIQDEMKESDELKFCFVDEKKAKEGVENGEYYAIIIIPEDFTSNISSANSNEKTPAKLIYSPNEKTNYLATQILNRAILELSDSVKEKVTEEIVGELSDNLKQVPERLNELNDGIEQLHDGAIQLNTGVTTFKTGMNSLNTNYVTFNTGILSLQSGVNQLSTGTTQLNAGISKVATGASALKQATTNISKLSDGLTALSTGTNTINTSTTQYVAGVEQYIEHSNVIGQKLAAYVAANPSSMSDPNMQYIVKQLKDPANTTNVNNLVKGGTELKAGTKLLNDSVKQFAEGTKDLPQLSTGLSSLSTGLEQLQTGSNKVNTGMSNLQLGMNKIATSSNDILNGIETLNDGANKLSDGTNKMENALQTANTEISDSIKTTQQDISKLEGLDTFAKQPLLVEQTTIHSVPNYGTAFSSYFMSLSLWVGGLIIFVGIYLDADEKFKILSRHSDRKILRTFIYVLIGIGQAVLLATVLRLGLHLQVNNVAAYYISCILVSIVFIAIIQFFMINFKDAGKFIVILLLILQLTSCGGTFPMELVPGFFNKLYAFMPMTYSVNLFKETISGTSASIISNNMIILSITFIVFTAMTVIGNIIRRNIEE